MDSIGSSMLFGVEYGVGYPRTGYPKERSIYGRIWNAADQTEAYYSDLASRLRREVTYKGGLILVVASHKSEFGR